MVLMTSVSSKILLVIDKGYWDYTEKGLPVGQYKILQYRNDLITIDSYSVDTLLFETLDSDTGRNGCFRLWQRLSIEYGNSLISMDTIKGIVLIGNLPVVILAGQCKANFHNDFTPADYYYQDIWNSDSGRAYSTDTVVWQYPIFHNRDSNIIYDSAMPYFDRYYYKTVKDTFSTYVGEGDKKLEMWASRIYAKSILHLREADSAWGNFLEEYEIIGNYLDRVHSRMTNTANVPSRSFVMGTNNFIFGDSINMVRILKGYFKIDTLPMTQINHFVGKESNAYVWQSQLQKGPRGNINSGAYGDKAFGGSMDTNVIFPQYGDDTLGFEWACILEHSGTQGHWFNCNNSNSHTPKSGKFVSFNNCSLWTLHTSGGYKGGSYYTCHNRVQLEPYIKGQRDYGSNGVHWTHTFDSNVHPEGKYHVFMWYDTSDSNDEKSWLNVCINGNVKYGRRVNQKIHYPDDDGDSWQEITWKKEKVIDTTIVGTDTTFDTSMVENRYPVYLRDGDVINIEFAASLKSTNIINDRAIADVVKLVCDSTGDSIVIDNIPPTFYSEVERKRTYLSMQDDGGQSKVLFYLTMACHINPFNVRNNLGNLYAMGHNGLISMGTSTVNTASCNYGYFLHKLREGGNFGEAALLMSQRDYPPSKIFALLGAGTLKAKAYDPYFDFVNLTIDTTIINNYRLYYVKNNTFIKDSQINNGGSLKILSGNDVIITPEFLSKYGSKLDITVDPLFF
jgi:hypothetical protein